MIIEIHTVVRCYALEALVVFTSLDPQEAVMAKTQSLRCPQCERTFSMPAHLGRHMATIHGARPRSAAPARGPARSPGRGRLPIGATRGDHGLAKVLSEVRAHREALEAERTALDGQIEALDRALSALESRRHG